MNYLALLKALGATLGVILIFVAVMYLVKLYAIQILLGMLVLGVTALFGVLTVAFYDKFKK